MEETLKDEARNMGIPTSFVMLYGMENLPPDKLTSKAFRYT